MCTKNEKKADGVEHKSESNGWVLFPKNPTKKVLLRYIKKDIGSMDMEQIRKVYKRVRRIVSGLE